MKSAKKDLGNTGCVGCQPKEGRPELSGENGPLQQEEVSTLCVDTPTYLFSIEHEMCH